MADWWQSLSTTHDFPRLLPTSNPKNSDVHELHKWALQPAGAHIRNKKYGKPDQGPI